MQNTPREPSAMLSTFTKLPFVFKTIILSIFEWPLKTGFYCSLYSLFQCLFQQRQVHPFCLIFKGSFEKNKNTETNALIMPKIAKIEAHI